MTMTWDPVDDGATPGQPGSEFGVILRDDEHPLGARITLKRDGDVAPYAITCGIYGWMMHAHFASTEAEAQRDGDRMRGAVGDTRRSARRSGRQATKLAKRRTYAAITRFVERFR